MSQSHEALVRDVYEAFGAGDIPTILATLDEDVDWRSPENLPHGGSYRGRDGVGAFFQAIGENWQELSLQLDGVSTSGDQVIAIARITGRLKGGAGETGYGAVHVWTARNGALVRFAEYVDAPLTLVADRALAG